MKCLLMKSLKPKFCNKYKKVDVFVLWNEFKQMYLGDNKNIFFKVQNFFGQAIN